VLKNSLGCLFLVAGSILNLSDANACGGTDNGTRQNASERVVSLNRPCRVERSMSDIPIAGVSGRRVRSRIGRSACSEAARDCQSNLLPPFLPANLPDTLFERLNMTFSVIEKCAHSLWVEVQRLTAIVPDHQGEGGKIRVGLISEGRIDREQGISALRRNAADPLVVCYSRGVSRLVGFQRSRTAAQ
jgi:hypothetical protein